MAKELTLLDHAKGIIKLVEDLTSNSQPCPLCNQFSGHHQTHCPYLPLWGMCQEPAPTEFVVGAKKAIFNIPGDDTEKPE